MLHSFSYVIPAVHQVLETKLVSYNQMSSLVLYNLYVHVHKYSYYKVVLSYVLSYLSLLTVTCIFIYLVGQWKFTMC